MNKLGVIEGFFGPAWPDEDRLSYAKFLSEYGGDFYIYAPKQDPHLRKAWREEWDHTYLNKLQSLADHFNNHKITFGVGLSPFGLGREFSVSDKDNLKNKLNQLNGVGVNLLGLFFDDMPSDEFLAETQLKALELVKAEFKGKIIFCPTYYTFDPILEKVFGKMPEGYFSSMANNVPMDVELAWTGPKVISPIINEEHLIEVKSLLKRKPFIWENLFANDGPRNCKFLKLRPFDGRDEKAFKQTTGFGLNMMNQAELSKYTYLASKFVLEGESNVELAFDKAISELCSIEFKDFILSNRKDFLELGLDQLNDERKQILISELEKFDDKGALEIKAWLQGLYIVGSECLTD